MLATAALLAIVALKAGIVAMLIGGIVHMWPIMDVRMLFIHKQLYCGSLKLQIQNPSLHLTGDIVTSR